MKNTLKKLSPISLIFLIIIVTIIYYFSRPIPPTYSFSLDDIPAYSVDPFVELQSNEPDFTDSDMTLDSYEYYSNLDKWGRCGYAIACLGTDLMPIEDRGSISHIKPSGWVQGQYDFVEGNSLYNRCHLIGFQLAGENDNEKNLITGTRFCNVQGMLPFENMVADYINETDNHVLYRVTPVYNGEELVARGVQMEAWSVEDGGEGICFNVFVYNIQPGVLIDYATGQNQIDTSYDLGNLSENVYIINIRSGKFHTEDCSQVQTINKWNREKFRGDRNELILQGYKPSGCCDP